jgi:hypothetical protein
VTIYRICDDRGQIEEVLKGNIIAPLSDFHIYLRPVGIPPCAQHALLENAAIFIVTSTINGGVDGNRIFCKDHTNIFMDTCTVSPKCDVGGI